MTPIEKALKYLAPKYDLQLEDVKYLLGLKVNEKEVIIDAYNIGYDRAMTKYNICENDRELRTAEQYYKETFNK